MIITKQPVVIASVLIVCVHTADFMKKVLSMYTHSMTIIDPSLSAQVAEETIFRKSPVHVFCQ